MYEYILSLQFVEAFEEYLKDKNIEYTKHKDKYITRGTKEIKIVQYFASMSFARAVATDNFLGELYTKIYEKHPEADLICE